MPHLQEYEFAIREVKLLQMMNHVNVVQLIEVLAASVAGVREKGRKSRKKPHTWLSGQTLKPTTAPFLLNSHLLFLPCLPPKPTPALTHGHMPAAFVREL